MHASLAPWRSKTIGQCRRNFVLESRSQRHLRSLELYNCPKPFLRFTTHVRGWHRDGPYIYLPCTFAGGGGGGSDDTRKYVHDDESDGGGKNCTSCLFILGCLPDAQESPTHEAEPPRISVRKTFGKSTVLLTGCTGYVGSLVLELLLRTCPDIDAVYVLVRDQKQPAKERVQELLQGPLFEQCAKAIGEKQLFGKVHVVQGDLLQQHCGIDDCTQLKLANNPLYVIHCAASINFSDDVHTLLQSNYVATRNLLQLVAKLRSARGLVHVSTAYVNGNMPKGSLVAEELYPLPLSDADGGHQAVVQQLLDMDLKAAMKRAQRHLTATGYPNMYCFSKRLAEEIVVEAAAQQLPVAIVRPSIIGCVHQQPLPGYVGNKGGATGAALAVGLGLAQYTSWLPDHIIDLVPGECVASAVLLVAARLNAETQAGQPPLSCPPSTLSCPPSRSPLIFHVGTSTTTPLTNRQFYSSVVHHFSQHPPKLRLPLTSYAPYNDATTVTGTWGRALHDGWGNVRIGAVSCLLYGMGRRVAAYRLWNAWKAWKMVNTPELDFNLRFCCGSMQHLQNSLVPDESRLFNAVWHETGCDWASYLSAYMAGVRRFCLKEHTPALEVTNKDCSIEVANYDCLNKP